MSSSCPRNVYATGKVVPAAGIRSLTPPCLLIETHNRLGSSTPSSSSSGTIVKVIGSFKRASVLCAKQLRPSDARPPPRGASSHMLGVTEAADANVKHDSRVSHRLQDRGAVVHLP